MHWQDELEEISRTPDGTPYSERYGDEYCSRNGPEQAGEVFVGPCRVAEREAPAVLELGFGLGLNLAATLRALGAGAAARYVGVELHPVRIEQFADAHLAGGVDDDAARSVIEAYPKLVQGGAVDVRGSRVEVLVGDAAERLAELPGDEPFDAVYLDGFTPARNPSLWRPEVFDQVGRLTPAGAIAATYSSARPVRDELTRVGFDVVRRRGFRGKRHRLVATRLNPA